MNKDIFLKRDKFLTDEAFVVADLMYENVTFETDRDDRNIILIDLREFIPEPLVSISFLTKKENLLIELIYLEIVLSHHRENMDDVVEIVELIKTNLSNKLSTTFEDINIIIDQIDIYNFLNLYDTLDKFYYPTWNKLFVGWWNMDLKQCGLLLTY